tara:strand:- start:188 stop:1846 length:1659 start_codon:yes stop_codon:yes gene_type:complete
MLALKYRPKNFRELIGQDIIVQTISNSIRLNKLPNAYLLTGIRGVGKTTTARLIAKALNCNKDFLKEENCNCNNCVEISNSKHLDVLEMDAASRTGIDDVRELIESSKYNPTIAKYKIFIIDEVHMLSKQAFNGLLKTLEEPPRHLKFIFATTEVKKIPVTIISRCQRFDLHRVPISVLLNNLRKILKNESGKISDSGLKLIAKASEGSVRDSLSLLDRALVSQQASEKEIDEDFIRNMLGIADRSKILQILLFITEGNQKKSIEDLRKLVGEGIDPVNFLNDLLETIYLILQQKEIGNIQQDLSLSETELSMMNSISEKVNKSTLMIFWQFIFKGLEELSIVSNQILLLEMLVIRLLHLKDMPSYQSVLDLIKENELTDEKINLVQAKSIKNDSNNNLEIKKKPQKQIKTTGQIKIELETEREKNLSKIHIENISSFKDLIDITSKKREIELKYELEKNVNLIRFTKGKIDISLNNNLDKDFVRNLSKKLFEWTGKRWVITLTKEKGQKTYHEQKQIKNIEILNQEKKKETYKKFKEAFSDLELIEVFDKE